MKTRVSVLTSAVLLVCCLAVLPVSSQTYTITNLGTLGGSLSYARAVNDSGQVVGYSYTTSGEYHAFSWTPEGGMVDLGTLGGALSWANAVNASGQVVGYSYLTSGTYHAFSWTPGGGMVDLGTLGGIDSNARAVNDSGQVVGDARTAGNRNHAFSWTPEGGMVDLGTLGAGGTSAADLVNGSGQVVGWSATTTSGLTHAFSWTPEGGMVDLGTLGGALSRANAVNDSGQVVGWSRIDSGAYYHPFSWTPGGGMVDLGTLGGPYSVASAVNASGQVVGYSQIASGEYHAFSWTPEGGMVDLGTLGGAQSWANAVNASGQVVGYSTYSSSGLTHAFSWTPVDGMVDLNTCIPDAPPGIELYDARFISDTGFIVARSNVGWVILGLNSSAPAVGPISANDPVANGAPGVFVSASFTDADTVDTHTALWSWGDGTTSAGSVSEANGAGVASGAHVFSEAGIYTVGLTITDTTGRTAQVTCNVVVYDPSAGFVTGGGWIISPPGALKENSTLAGRATFGFVSKYHKGATVPTGNTEFQFHAAELNFHSDSYDWLVVSGSRAQYKGTGSINGLGAYKFLLTAIDGDKDEITKPDRFRIKIWYYDSDLEQDVVVYDNQIDASTEGTANEGTLIGGGSIVIHTK